MSWRSSVAAVPPQSGYATLGPLKTYYTQGAFADAGTRTFAATAGLTVGMLFSTSAMAAAPCTPTANFTAEGFPSSWALFDIGGYALYASIAACAPGYSVSGVPNAQTVLAVPGATPVSYVGRGVPRSPLLLAQHERYTFVTFGPAGARVYVNGSPVATFPALTYAAAQWTAPHVRFYFGDMHNGGAALSVALHDVQLYTRELSAGEVASLSRGVEVTC